MRALNIFPVSYKVQNKSIVIVGGGEEALNKARLAVKTSARVRVFARAPMVDFSNLSVELISRQVELADLDDAALVFVEGGDAGARAGIKAAKRVGVPLNVIDQPDLCDFYTPAIVDRAPLAVAISSDGQTPVLSRVVRARIEAILSPELGGLAKIGGELRQQVTKLLSKSGVRQFYEALSTGGAVEHALKDGLPAGRRAALRLLDQVSSADALPGFVWFVDAGPGAQDLLTLRAQRVLQEADVIVYDQSVSHEIVEMGRRDALFAAVGVGSDLSSIREINALLAKFAKKNLRIAYLIASDAGGIETVRAQVEALRSVDVGIEIVPGAGRDLSALIKHSADAVVFQANLSSAIDADASRENAQR